MSNTPEERLLNGEVTPELIWEWLCELGGPDSGEALEQIRRLHDRFVRQYGNARRGAVVGNFEPQRPQYLWLDGFWNSQVRHSITDYQPKGPLFGKTDSGLGYGISAIRRNTLPSNRADSRECTWGLRQPYTKGPLSYHTLAWKNRSEM